MVLPVGLAVLLRVLAHGLSAHHSPVGTTRAALERLDESQHPEPAVRRFVGLIRDYHDLWSPTAAS